MSSVVPDLISSSTDAPPPDPSQAPSAMETDDTNEALPAPSSAPDSSQHIVSSTIPDPTNVVAPAPPPPVPVPAVPITAAVAAAEPSKPLGDVDKHRVHLEALELEITGELTAANYGELLLIYLVQFKLIDAKYCYLRAAEKYTKDAALKELWKIGAAVSKADYGRALKLCRSGNFNPTLKPLIAELVNRLTALQVEVVVKCYTSLEKETLAELFGLPTGGEDLARLIAATGWRVDGGFVLPVETSESRAFAARLIDTTFGEFQRPGAKEKASEQLISSADIDALKKLVAANDFIDIHMVA